MKKFVTIFAACALAAASVCALSACSLFGYSADGNFPYDISVQGGYTGSEGEWLSEREAPETIYRRLYDEALADGSFTGTYFQFLKELGVSADATPYIQRAFLSTVMVSCRFTTADNKLVTSSGAGVIIDLDKAAGDAYILTNYHVLYNSTRKAISENIGVRLYGTTLTGEAISASYYGGAMEYDLALLRIENSSVLRESDARVADIGDSDSVIAGETVYAVGNPLNESLSVAAGVVSVEEEWLTLKVSDDTAYITLPEIRIDAAVNHGNSGGALFNATGELLGIVNARDTREDVLGFGYAIPVNFAMAAAENMLANGGTLVHVDDGIIVEVQSSKAVYDEALGRTHISEKICVKDYTVGAGSALYVRQGDTLVSGYVERNGEQLYRTDFTRLGQFEAFLFRVQRGDTLVITVSRDGEAKTLRAVLDRSTYFSTVR